MSSHGLDALFTSDEFVARLAGLPSKLPEPREQIETEIKQGFEALALPAKELLVFAEPHAAALHLAWQRLPADRQQKVIASLRDEVRKPEQVFAATRQLEMVAYQQTEFDQINARVNAFLSALPGFGAKMGTLTGMSAGLSSFGAGFSGR